MTRDKSGKLKDTGVRFQDIAGVSWPFSLLGEQLACWLVLSLHCCCVA